MNTWQTAQSWEAKWWATCQNTYGEEEKQLLYARRMGLKFFHDKKSPYNIANMENIKVVDLGGGPVSLLLKCPGIVGTVVDPLEIPDWVKSRYELAGIQFVQEPAETFSQNGYDEAWIYNCLQHTDSPEQIIEVAKRSAKIIRIFEWINTSTNEGHPHSFTPGQLNQWLGGEGKTELLRGEANCYGECYYGIFPTN